MSLRSKLLTALRAVGRQSFRFRPVLETLESRELLSLSVGMNIERVTDYSADWKFTDAFRESRPWIRQAYDQTANQSSLDTSITVDANGNPTMLTHQADPTTGHMVLQQVSTNMFFNVGGHYPAGTYTAWWQGDGRVGFTGDVVAGSIQLGSATGADGQQYHTANFTIAPASQGIQMVVTPIGTVDVNPIHDVHVWMPDYNGQSFVGQLWHPGASFSPFHPLFLQRLASFHTLRFMQDSEIISSNVQHWSDVRPWNYETQQTPDASSGYTLVNGIAPEYIVELCNELNADAWINIPHLADDGYVTNLATLVHNTLNPNLHVNLEWSNEVWNHAPGYLASRWIDQQLTLPQYAGWTAPQFVAATESHVYSLWTGVFADHPGQLIRVVAGGPVTRYDTQLLSWMHQDGDFFDAWSVNAYFGVSPTTVAAYTANTPVSQVLADLSASIPATISNLQANDAIAVQYSTLLGRHIHFVAYEGGPILMDTGNPAAVAIVNAASVDPQVYGIFLNFLNQANTTGLELLENYEFTARNTPNDPNGIFGALNYMDEPIADAAKYHALLDFMGMTVGDPTPTPTPVPSPSPTPTPIVSVPSAAVPTPVTPAAPTTPAVDPIFATGADAGGGPLVNVYDARTGSLITSFFAFPAGFTGGVRVAVGDVNGDGTPDIIVGAGPGGGPEVRVFDGKSFQIIRDFMALPVSFTGGVYVAAGDVNGDGWADIVTAADQGGGPEVTITDGRTGVALAGFYATASTFTGGIRVACADVNGDGFADVIASAGPGGGPQVTIFDGRSLRLLTAFYALTPTFAGGVYVAAGDVTGAGQAEIIAGAGAGGGPQVAVYDSTGSLLESFYALAPTFTGGVRVGVMNGGAGPMRLLTAAGPGGGPQVDAFDGSTLASLNSFFAYDPSFRGGVHIGG